MLDIQTLLMEELVQFLANGCQNDVLQRLSSGFLELGFSKTIIFLKTSSSNGELKQVFPNEFDFKLNFKPNLIEKEKEHYFIEKPAAFGANQAFVVMPLSCKTACFGALVLQADEKTLQRWSGDYKKIGYVFSLFMQSLDLIQKQNLAENKKLKTKLCLLHLSDKQSTIVELLLNGRSNKEIAKSINLTEQAIKYHVGNMLSKFQCKNRKELRSKINELIV
ncbi:MAG: hypothetical protein IPM57_12075 [Oligoflexia bacterium]|nr:hypothetical protein [Oligoflexia bacterium]